MKNTKSRDTNPRNTKSKNTRILKKRRRRNTKPRKATKRLEYTPNSVIRNALRALWLRSRERQNALKRDGYACQHCGAKLSRARGKEQDVTVHHIHGIDWEEVIRLVREKVLQKPEDLQTLCPACHDEETALPDPLA